MSTDVNDFDTYLKVRLHRDLLFRTIVWLVVSVLTAFLSIRVGGSTALSYFEKVSNTLAPLLNSIGVGGILICWIALLLKDLEVVSENPQTVAATSGMIGGFVRRVSGDISLWTLGALIAMLSALIVVVVPNIPMSLRDAGAAAYLGFLLVLMTALTAIANVLVRRAGATPWAKSFNSTWLVVMYVLVFLFLTWRVSRAVI